MPSPQVEELLEEFELELLDEFEEEFELELLEELLDVFELVLLEVFELVLLRCWSWCCWRSSSSTGTEGWA